MSLNDWLLINGNSLIGWAASFVVLAIIYSLLHDWFEDEARDFFRLVMIGICLLMLLSFGYSMLQSQYIHTDRTTIDRSVGDEEYEQLKQEYGEGEVE